MVELFVQSRYKVDRRKLKRRVRVFLEKMGVSLFDYDLSLAIVGDRKIKELNKKFRQKEEAAPVLAFPMQRDSPATEKIRATLLGEIVISYPQARLLAGEENKLVEEKIAELVEHGLSQLLVA